jgi:hypothetical protein
VATANTVRLYGVRDDAMRLQVPLPGHVWGLCSPAPSLLAAVVGGQVHVLRIPAS